MKKFILAVAVAVFSIAGAQAQNASPSTTLNLGINAGIPTNTGISFAYGADLEADFAVAASTKITASAGYQGYTLKGVNASTYYIPVLAGVKFNLGERTYAHGQLGYGFAEGGSGACGYAPSLGYYFSPKLDASVKYLAFSRDNATTGSVNLRLAYNF